ncbi:MAG: hypothetical protein E6G51_04965 [Actinobacteria bacterium]|jgi:hypothetical protein|nr:MAG: hypothetical protein E6G51_04965 [Actinomycetota bacterium]
MSFYLIVNPESDPETGQLQGAKYRIPDTADPSTLPENLAKGMRGQASVTVSVEMEDGTTGLLVLNGNTVTSLLLAEDPASGEEPPD